MSPLAPRLLVVAVGLLGLILVLSAVGRQKLFFYGGEWGPSKARYPYAAIEILRREGPGAVVYSTPDWGGFITRSMKGLVKPVLDDRNTLLGEQPYRDFMAVRRGAPNWRELVRATGANFMLVKKGDPIDLLLPRRPPELLFEDELSALIRVGIP